MVGGALTRAALGGSTDMPFNQEHVRLLTQLATNPRDLYSAKAIKKKAPDELPGLFERCGRWGEA